MFSWGANSYGQLGLGHQDDKSKPEKILKIPDGKIVDVTGGGGHTLLLTDCGAIYSCGWNSKGQLGLGHTDNLSVFKRIDHLPPVIKVTCGWDFCLAITEVGDLYAWGCNVFGQLGIPEIDSFTAIPTKIQIFSRNVTSIAAGLRHSLAVTNDGKLWSWGSARKGQLGNDQSKTGYQLLQRVPKQVHKLENISSVSSGSYHSTALTACGNMYLWGSNKHNQLTNSVQGVVQSGGSSKEDILPVPTKLNLELFGGRQILAVHSGWTHILAITHDSNVFGWGRNDYSQLGISLTGNNCAKKDVTKPKELVILKDIKQIACGSEHNLALSDDNKVLAWGWNEHGSCGNGKEENVLTPQVIDDLAKEKIRLIGIGAAHCFAVAS